MMVLAAVWMALLSGCGSHPASLPPPGSSGYPGTSSGAQVLSETLVIPTTPHDVVHEVGPMETLWRLSRMYSVPMEDIVRANHLPGNGIIKIGQKLTIPRAKTFHNMVYLYPSRKWRYIIVHHTATEIGNATLINKTHHDRGFWNGLGYHFLIDNGSLRKGDGQIEMAPRWIKQQDGAHCRAGGMNHQAIGIALVGNFNEELPTKNQLQSLAVLINALSRYYKIPANRVMGHRDVAGANTDCPGINFPWPRVRRYLARY